MLMAATAMTTNTDLYAPSYGFLQPRTCVVVRFSLYSTKRSWCGLSLGHCSILPGPRLPPLYHHKQQPFMTGHSLPAVPADFSLPHPTHPPNFKVRLMLHRHPPLVITSTTTTMSTSPTCRPCRPCAS